MQEKQTSIILMYPKLCEDIIVHGPQIIPPVLKIMFDIFPIKESQWVRKQGGQRLLANLTVASKMNTTLKREMAFLSAFFKALCKFVRSKLESCAQPCFSPNRTKSCIYVPDSAPCSFICRHWHGVSSHYSHPAPRDRAYVCSSLNQSQQGFTPSAHPVYSVSCISLSVCVCFLPLHTMHLV